MPTDPTPEPRADVEALRDLIEWIEDGEYAPTTSDRVNAIRLIEAAAAELERLREENVAMRANIRRLRKENEELILRNAEIRSARDRLLACQAPERPTPAPAEESETVVVRVWWELDQLRGEPITVAVGDLTPDWVDDPRSMDIRIPASAPPALFEPREVEGRVESDG